MIETIMLIVVIFVLSGVFWYSFFYQKEKKLFNRLQRMLDCAIDGELERTEISEEKYSALENSMKQYIDSSFLAKKNQREQKEVIQKFISDIAHQTLTPISNLKVYGEILSEVSNENQEEIATILEQTEKLDFLIQSLVKLSRMESGIIAVHPEDTAIAQMFASVQQQFNVKAMEKDISLSLFDTDLHAMCDAKWTVEALGNIVDNAIKYTACGGNVQVKAEQNSFFVKIDIIDDGIGIEKEEIPKIFGRFYRSLSVADQPGVGIGLFLAREIIQAQKGYIKVTSKRGKRADVFHLYDQKKQLKVISQRVCVQILYLLILSCVGYVLFFWQKPGSVNEGISGIQIFLVYFIAMFGTIWLWSICSVILFFLKMFFTIRSSRE